MATPDLVRRAPVLRVRLAGLGARLPRLPQGTIEAVCAGLAALLPLLTYAQYANDKAGFVLELLFCLAVATVGRWPVPATLAAGALMTLMLGLPWETKRPILVVVVVLVTSLGARGYRWLQATIAIWWLAVMLLLENTPPQPIGRALTSTIGYLIFLLTAWLTGAAIHRVATERSRGQVDRTAAVQAQRRSIARDLHDTIAYSTTSIILRAEQAKLRGVADQNVAEDLDYIITAGRNTMRDLRGMMETLRRNDPDGGAPQAPWQVSSLEEVLAARLSELRNHGFAVTSNVDLERATLPESAREALTKVLVEATGNMIKHGDPKGPASILIESDPGEVEAVFINQPKRFGSAREMTAQLGLVGARERVEALGGEVHVTSESPDWVVRVRIPIGG